LTGGWATVDDIAVALDALPGDRALVAIDDLHALWGTEAEAAIERLVTLLPPNIVVLAATRRAPGFNLPRLLVSGDMLELGPDDLRFRPWEVERLFRDYYDAPMLPNELAELARRTDGWAAGLQLFHLATRGKPAAERRRVLGQLGQRSKLLREYLARNLLDELPIHVRDFLVRTCVLGRLTASLCDEMTGATSSDALLDELVQRQIFTAVVDDEGSYRYHEVLRSHLEGVLVEQVGEPVARERFLRAGGLLEAHGYLADAIRAYGRAEAWEELTRLLGGRAEEVVDRPGDWIDALPSALLEHDPWLLLGVARRYGSQGHADAAIDAYRRGELAAGASQPAEICRRERQAMAAWFAPAPTRPADWVAGLRQATAHDPRRVATGAWSNAEGELVAGAAALLAGNVIDAAARLERLAAEGDTSPIIAVAASVGAVAARALAGEPVVADVDLIGEHADAAGVPWLASIARAIALADVDGPGDFLAAGLPKADPWGSALARFFAGVGALRRRDSARAGELDATVVLADATEAFRSLDAPVLAAWSAVAYAVAVGAASGVRRAANAAAVLGVDAGVLMAAVATGEPARDGGGAVAVRCFGTFRVTIEGATVDLAAIKPRVRSLVRLLALHGGEPVHRERIIECLWPDEPDVKVGTRNLQVAVSSLRQLVEPGVQRGAAAVVVREGDGYRLALRDDTASDLLTFWRTIERARAARVAGDAPAALAAYTAALDAYVGDLLADEGPAEWVVAERDRSRLAAGDAAQAIAELAVDAGNPAAAIAAAERGIRIDAYRDGLWRALIAAHEASGDRAAATRASTQYRKVLAELGVS
jgi:DNA-binding SARP family transcriptional activator